MKRNADPTYRWIETDRRLLPDRVAVFAPTGNRGMYFPYVACQYEVTESLNDGGSWEIRTRIVDGDPFYMSDASTPGTVRLAHAAMAPLIEAVVVAERNRSRGQDS